MNVTIKHAGRKAEIVEQSNNIPVCRIYDNKDNLLRSRSFPNMGLALDFAVQWLYDMESEVSKEYVNLLHRWEKANIAVGV